MLLYLAGSWGSLASVALFSSAIFSDILLVRLALVVGNLLLIVASLLGSPDLPNWGPTGKVAAGTAAFATLSLIFHGYAFFCLAWDERPIRFASEDEEQLWRLFFRRSGMGRLEFRELLKRGKWLRYKAGDAALDVSSTKSESESCMFVVVEGFLTFVRHNKPTNVYSGEMVNFALCNLFGVAIGFEHFRLDRIVCGTDCLLFGWRVDQVDEMAKKISPSVELFWRNFILSQLGSQYSRRLSHAPGWHPACSRGLPEADDWLRGGRSRDLTDPLADDEMEKSGPREWLRWILSSVNPKMPLGHRHRSLPHTGRFARSRVLVMQELHRQRTESLGMFMVALEQMEAEGMLSSCAAGIGRSSHSGETDGEESRVNTPRTANGTPAASPSKRTVARLVNWRWHGGDVEAGVKQPLLQRS